MAVYYEYGDGRQAGQCDRTAAGSCSGETSSTTLLLRVAEPRTSGLLWQVRHVTFTHSTCRSGEGGPRSGKGSVGSPERGTGRRQGGNRSVDRQPPAHSRMATGKGKGRGRRARTHSPSGPQAAPLVKDEAPPAAGAGGSRSVVEDLVRLPPWLVARLSQPVAEVPPRTVLPPQAQQALEAVKAALVAGRYGDATQ